MATEGWRQRMTMVRPECFTSSLVDQFETGAGDALFRQTKDSQ